MRRAITVVGAFMLVLASCGGDTASPEATTVETTESPPTTAEPATTTEAPTTTTSPPTTTEATTTTIPWSLRADTLQGLNEIAVTEPSDYSVRAVEISPDGSLVAVANHLFVDIFEVASAELITSLPQGGSAGWVIDWSPDGGLLATHINNTSQVKVWDTATWDLLYEMSDPTPMGVVWGFEPDGSDFVMANGAEVTIVPARTGTPESTLAGDGQLAASLAFAPDGSTMAVVLDDHVILYSDDGQVTLPEDSEFITNSDITRASSVFWDPSGALIGTVESPMFASIRLWDAETLAGVGGLGCSWGILGDDWFGHPTQWDSPCVVGPNDRISTAVFSPDGAYVAAYSQPEGAVYVWETATSTLLWRLDAPFGGDVEFTDPTTLFIGGTTHTFWNVTTGEQFFELAVPNAVTWSDVSPDGRYLVTGDIDGAVYFWAVQG